MILSPVNQFSSVTQECSARFVSLEVMKLHEDSSLVVILRVNLSSSSQARKNALQRVEPSMHYMMQHLAQPLKVAELSGHVGLSNSQFFSLFKSAIGHTPIDFLIRTRMQIAVGLLLNTALQIKQIAVLLGYEDELYFSRLFKSVHGISPHHYRIRKEIPQTSLPALSINSCRNAKRSLPVVKGKLVIAATSNVREDAQLYSFPVECLSIAKFQLVSHSAVP